MALVWVTIPVVVLGRQAVLITSDSMAPALRAGDVILLTGPAEEHLGPGAVVTFSAPGDPERLIPHRISDTTDDGLLLTKGDANPLVDSTPVDPSTVHGRARLLVSTVGIPLLWHHEGNHLLVLPWMVATVGAVHYVITYLRRGQRPDADETSAPQAPTETPRRAALGRVALVTAFVALGTLPQVTAAAAFSDSTANAGSSFAASEWEAILGLVGGVGHSCGVNDEGVVWCWGLNDKGQLGEGTTTDRVAPTAVPGLSGVEEIGAGGKHSCAVKSDGTVWCWGLNDKGQLGDTTTTDATSPVAAAGT